MLATNFSFVLQAPRWQLQSRFLTRDVIPFFEEQSIPSIRQMTYQYLHDRQRNVHPELLLRGIQITQLFCVRAQLTQGDLSSPYEFMCCNHLISKMIGGKTN